MPRTVRCGLIQTRNVLGPDRELAAIKKAMIDKHVALIGEAAGKKVKVLCLQELFYGPYFCAEQETRWYDLTERVPDGPTITLIAKLAKKHRMRHGRAGLRGGAGRRLLQHRGRHRRRRHVSRQVPQDAHPARASRASGRSSTSAPATSAIRSSTPAFAKIGVYICYDRHFPEGARALGLNGAEIVFNPSATVAGLSRVPVEAGAAGARGGQRLLRRRHQPRRHRGAVEHRRVLRPELLLRSARPDPRRGAARQGRSRRRRPGPRPDRRGAERPGSSIAIAGPTRTGRSSSP